MIYQFDSKSGKLSPARQPWAAVKAGAGPRHLTFHPNGLHAYVINELDATVSAFEFDPASGALKELQNLPNVARGLQRRKYQCGYSYNARREVPLLLKPRL